MTAPLSWQNEEEVAAQEDLPEDDKDNLLNNTLYNLQVVLSVIEKVVGLHTIS